MDKLIYTAFNTVNNIYDNRAVRAQNLANISVPGYKRDLGSKSVGTAFLDNIQTLHTSFSLHCGLRSPSTAWQ